MAGLDPAINVRDADITGFPGMLVQVGRHI